MPESQPADRTATIWIALVTITLIAIVGVVIVNRRPTAPVLDDQARLTAAVARIGEGKQAYQEWSRTQQAGQPDQAAHARALSGLQEGVEALQAVLFRPPYVDEDGLLLPEFEGYENELSEAAQLIVDLEKGSSLH